MAMTVYLAILATFLTLAAGILDQDLYTKYQTISKPDFINYFNKQDYTWKMKEYVNLSRHFTAHSHIDYEAFNKLPLKKFAPEELKDLPLSFDARVNWPKCEYIQDIFDQSFCDSSWMFSTASAATDRTCIHKDTHVRLAAQDFECMKQSACAGGDTAKAFEYWKTSGLVTQKCKPYDLVNLFSNMCKNECIQASETDFVKDKHFAQEVYRVSNKSDEIKAELVKNGPIVANFHYFQDLQNYDRGVFEHKFGKEIGILSVRIIGYGVNNKDEYWLVANSWSDRWGEQGLIRIKAYQEALKFEEYLVTGLPKN